MPTGAPIEDSDDPSDAAHGAVPAAVSRGDAPPPHSVLIQEWTSPQFAQYRPNILLVPLGATEQHGPHLPLGTDTMIAAAWCRHTAAELPGVAVAPTLAYGASGEHQGFAGTLSIGTDALVTVLIELARSLRGQVGRTVFVSGHGGNAEAVTRAVRQLRAEEHPVDAVLLTIPGGDAHAGHSETSLMQWLHPDLVAMERAEVGRTEPIRELFAELRRGGVISVSPNGILGDPTDANTISGQQIFAELITSLMSSLKAP